MSMQRMIKAFTGRRTAARRQRHSAAAAANARPMIRSAAASAVEQLEGRTMLSVANGGFESGTLSPWAFSGPSFSEGEIVSSTQPSHYASATGITPYDGTYAAVLTPAAQNQTTQITQTITVNAGDQITGVAYFTSVEGLATSSFYNDFARIQIRQGTTTVATPFQATVLNHTKAWVPWSYTFTAAGTFTIAATIVNVTDASQNSHLGVDAVTFVPANKPPVAADDAFVTAEDTAVSGDLLGNDTDPNNDVLRAVLGTGPAHGTVVLNGDGTFTYTPHENYYGSDSFTYQAVDAKDAASNVAMVTIDVSPVNDAPTLGLIALPVTTDEGGTLGFTASASDVDAGASLSFSLAGAPAGASIDPATGEFTWTAVNEGTFTFDVVVTDELGASATQTVSVTVSNVAPVAAITGAPVDGPEGTTITLGSDVTDAGVLDTHTYAWTVLKDGEAYATGTGNVLDFTPDDNGAYEVTLVVTDDGDASGTAAVATISVLNVAPTASIGDPSTVLVSGEWITLQGSAADAGTADSFTYSWTVTRDGSPFAAGTGSDVTFRPDDAGTYVIALTATDDDLGSGTASKSVDVIALPVSVQAATAPSAAVEGGDVIVSGTVSGGTGTGVYDVTIEWGDGSSEVVRTTDGTYSATHRYLDDDADDTYAVVVTAHDAALRQGTTTAAVTVKNVAPSAQITNFVAGAAYTVGTTLPLSGKLSDAGTLDTHTASFLITSPDLPGPVSVPAVVNADGTVSASYTFGVTGVFHVSLTVIDDDGGMTTVGTADGADAVVLIVSGNVSSTAGKLFGSSSFASPAGTSTLDPTLSDRAYISVSTVYEEGSTQPTGRVTFKFGNLYFKSNVCDSLVIQGNKATVQGTGTINGTGSYAFRITVIDNGSGSGPTRDLIRVRIWDSATGTVVYDSNPGAATDATPTTELSSGGLTVRA